MKKIVLKPLREEVYIDNVFDSCFVGIFFRNEQKAMLVNTEHNYYAVCLHDSRMDGLDKWVSNSKQAYITKAINDYGAKAYVFDTFGDLVKWLNE